MREPPLPFPQKRRSKCAWNTSFGRSAPVHRSREARVIASGTHSSSRPDELWGCIAQSLYQHTLEKRLLARRRRSRAGDAARAFATATGRAPHYAAPESAASLIASALLNRAAPRDAASRRRGTARAGDQAHPPIGQPSPSRSALSAHRPRFAECSTRSKGATAGPASTAPCAVKREPWQGQSQVRSSAFQPTTQPR
jgi:hypothetical protein